MIRRSAAGLLLALIALCFMGCSSAVPSESDGRAFLEEKGKALNDLYKVKSFAKKNGAGDEKSYRVQFAAELECLHSNAVAPGGIQFVEGGVENIVCHGPGEIVKKNGTLFFEKTENGWKVVNSSPF